MPGLFCRRGPVSSTATGVSPSVCPKISLAISATNPPEEASAPLLTNIRESIQPLSAWSAEESTVGLNQKSFAAQRCPNPLLLCSEQKPSMILCDASFGLSPSLSPPAAFSGVGDESIATECNRTGILSLSPERVLASTATEIGCAVPSGKTRAKFPLW